MRGTKLKIDRLRRLKRNAELHNSTAYVLPVYRSLVSRTTSLIIPHLQSWIDTESARRGRPGINKVAIPYLLAVGADRAAAIAVATVVNHFHLSLSYQALSLKIGNDISFEWSILQEDSNVVSTVAKHTYSGSGRARREIYMRQQMQRILGRPLQNVSIEARASIGNVLLSLLQRTPLVSLSKNAKGMFIVSASDKVRERIDLSITHEAEQNPVGLPSLEPHKVDLETILRPQGHYLTSLSTVEGGEDSQIYKACDTLNHTGYRIDWDQLEFIKEIAQFPSGVLGLPGSEQPPMPEYYDNMDETERAEMRRARAKWYADQTLWRNNRTRMLSALGILNSYRNQEVYFNVNADFRGRLYPEADLLSYQGPDWIRSLWKFSEGVAITTQRQADWLRVHAANCYGLSRKSYESRISFIRDRMDLWRACDYDPIQRLDDIAKAKHPFRFLAAIRELVRFENGGLGYVSHLPVQIDASSQAIQIWAGMIGDQELLIKSNVLRDEDGYSVCHDIYHYLAKDIQDTAMDSADDGSQYWRVHEISRSVAKKCLMIIPYGGTFKGFQEAVNAEYPLAPFTARVWLARRLWEDGRDYLHSLVKVQERLSDCVLGHINQTGNETIQWQAPSGVLVRQRYMKQRRKRIKSALGTTLYSYKFDTDIVSPGKHASSVCANVLHSLDSSLLCRAVSLMDEYGVHSVMSIHDCVGVHAANVDKAKHFLNHAYVTTIAEGKAAIQDLCNILGGHDFGPALVYTGPHRIPKDPLVLSGYLFS